MNKSDYNTKLIKGLLLICSIFYIAKIIFQKEHFGGIMSKGMFGKGDDKTEEKKKEKKKEEKKEEKNTPVNTLTSGPTPTYRPCNGPPDICFFLENCVNKISNKEGIPDYTIFHPDNPPLPGKTENCRQFFLSSIKNYKFEGINDNFFLNFNMEELIHNIGVGIFSPCELGNDLCKCFDKIYKYSEIKKRFLNNTLGANFDNDIDTSFFNPSSNPLPGNTKNCKALFDECTNDVWCNKKKEAATATPIPYTTSGPATQSASGSSNGSNNPTQPATST